MPAANMPVAGGTVLDHVGLFVPDMARARPAPWSSSASR